MKDLRVCAQALPFLLVTACFAAELDFPRRTPIVAAVQRTGPAVVNIGARQITTSPFLGDLPRELYWFFNIQPRARKLTSVGSGTIIHPAGYVLTNAHVIERADNITARLADSRSFEAEVIAVNSKSDAALLKLKGEGPFPTASLGTSGDIMVGETVIAVGNPFGLENTVTTGVVSARRALMLGESEAGRDLIQISAPINPGNSGGPLLNINGQVIGVNTMIKSDAQNLGFAITIDRFKEELLQVLDEKKWGVWLGIDVRKVHSSNGSDPESAGLVVQSVQEDSPAERLSLASGDIITEVNGRAPTDALLFKLDLLTMQPGDRLKISYVRNDLTRRRSLTLAPAPELSHDKLIAERLGITLGRIPRQTASKLGVSSSYGIMIQAVKSRGPASGVLKPGDIILGVDRWRVHSADDVASLLQKSEPGARVGITFVRATEGVRYYTELILE